jgi:hypothetical protein
LLNKKTSISQQNCRKTAKLLRIGKRIFKNPTFLPEAVCTETLHKVDHCRAESLLVKLIRLKQKRQGVNFTNILKAAFTRTFLCQSRINLNLKYKKLSVELLYKKAASKLEFNHQMLNFCLFIVRQFFEIKQKDNCRSKNSSSFFCNLFSRHFNVSYVQIKNLNFKID